VYGTELPSHSVEIMKAEAAGRRLVLSLDAQSIFAPRFLVLQVVVLWMSDRRDRISLMGRSVVVTVLSLMLGSLSAQRALILDPKIQGETNDDVREIKTRDEMSRQAELNANLRLPSQAERDAIRAAHVQAFARDVTAFKSLISDLSTLRPSGTYSEQTVKVVRKKSRNVARSTQRMLTFLRSSKSVGEAIGPRDIPAETIEDRTGLLCLLAVRMDPQLNQLLAKERQNISDTGLRQAVAAQLRLIAFLSSQIGRSGIGQ